MRTVRGGRRLANITAGTISHSAYAAWAPIVARPGLRSASTAQDG